ncbi:PKD domain-containing protein [Muriicola sp. Z0-33]|uniref:PKD domain-containing protein n=1 Tax=Muriicola sp. Z0-33 TaxID=2816957 RepID=UPI002238554A|nr:PKD domain-containing protein [Muriicola sp. Z0-33]MCW5515661.1 PKD domain-containing protein [Muriicola sp. Z0-33]
MYIFLLAIILACSNDIDILTDAVINDTETMVEEREAANSENEAGEQSETPPDEMGEGSGIEDGFVSRNTQFPPIEDAYVQSNKGYDQTIIRLDENNRTSYLKFDLTPIAAIDGYITDAVLQFTIESDEGNGTIDINKGLNTNWTEEELDDSNVPEIDILLGSITKEYKIGNTEEVLLSASDLLPEHTTLILRHQGGNDLAIASKEHPSKIGPKLLVSYHAPENADIIVIEEEEPATSDEEETPEEDSATTENAAPMAIADASPSAGQAPLEVTFTGSNSTDDNGVVSYSWDFKDGSTAAIANPKHTFSSIGTYEAVLTVTDAAGLSSTDNVTIKVNEEVNAAPIAQVSASPLSGVLPLEVSFVGSSSSDDNSIASYSWDFKDGTSASNANPTHIFNTSGSYLVELTVTDEQGLTDKESISITVNEPASNEAPVAEASANPMTGEAPLTVNFTGMNSFDDNGIISYLWDFPGGSSSDPNPEYTFNTPGVYDVMLTVTDDAGLTDTSTLSISVTQNTGGGSGGGTGCITNGGRADDTGFKSWCWEDISIPEYSDRKGVSFSNNELYIDSECYERQVTNSGSQLKFEIDPINPGVESWCSRNFNMRSEIRTAPWNVQHSLGTEEWFGWSYTFGNDYEIDQNNQWKFFQVYPGPPGLSPNISLEVIHATQFNNHNAGEVYVVRQGGDKDYRPTGFTPAAGEKLDIVVHVVWGDASTGLLQVWINDNLVFNENASTVHPGTPWGGNAKWGIYKWPWNNADQVQKSLNQGITKLTTYLGPIRMITRKPGDVDYGKNSYNEVSPN